MKSYSWLALGGQLRTGILIAGVVVGVVVPRVGVGQIFPPSVPSFNLNPENRVLADGVASELLSQKIFEVSTADPSKLEPAPIQKETKEEKSAPSTEEHGAQPEETEQEEEKRKKEEEAEAAQKALKELGDSMAEVPGTTVNDQKLYKATVNGKDYEFYHLNGDQKSNYISMKTSDGNFKWTTKNEMLGLKNTGPGGLTETGSLDIGNGRVTSMFEDNIGNRYYSTGQGGSWFKSEAGKNSYVANKELVTGRENNLSHYIKNPIRRGEYVTMPPQQPSQPSNPASFYAQPPPGQIDLTRRVFQPDAVQPSTFKDSPLVQRMDSGSMSSLLGEVQRAPSGGSNALPPRTGPPSVPSGGAATRSGGRLMRVCGGTTCQQIWVPD